MMRCSSFKALLGSVLLLVGWGASSQAQINVVLSSERVSYLLYEPMAVEVRVSNPTDSPIVLGGDGGQSWLSFIVLDSQNVKVRPEGKFDLPSEVVQPGQTIARSVDLTPLYAIRNSGQYRVQAVVRVPGRSDFVTGQVVLNVGKGETIWTKTISEDGTERIYSLIHFLDRKSASLYLRVEEPGENLVYTTVRLGNFVAFTQPRVDLDQSNNVHVVHAIGAKTYRYTHADDKGDILDQEDREAGATIPQLVRMPDGGIKFMGGVEEVARKERPKLSELQQGL